MIPCPECRAQLALHTRPHRRYICSVCDMSFPVAHIHALKYAMISTDARRAIDDALAEMVRSYEECFREAETQDERVFCATAARWYKCARREFRHQVAVKLAELRSDNRSRTESVRPCEPPRQAVPQ